MKQDINTGQKAPKKKGPKSLKDRIHKHIADKNDIITDEDLRNVKIGEDAFKEDANARQVLAEDLKKSNEFTDAIEERKATSPWTILTEEDK